MPNEGELDQKTFALDCHGEDTKGWLRSLRELNTWLYVGNPHPILNLSVLDFFAAMPDGEVLVFAEAHCDANRIEALFDAVVGNVYNGHYIESVKHRILVNDAFFQVSSPRWLQLERMDHGVVFAEHHISKDRLWVKAVDIAIKCAAKQKRIQVIVFGLSGYQTVVLLAAHGIVPSQVIIHPPEEMAVQFP